jgi:hypothetical protein
MESEGVKVMRETSPIYLCIVQIAKGYRHPKFSPDG